MTGPDLKRIRKKELRLRQAEFAEVLGVHKTTVSDWERDETRIVPRYAAMMATVMRNHPVVRDEVVELAGLA